MMVFAITYWKMVDEEKSEQVEIYKSDEFELFINKVLFYQKYPFEYNDMKVLKGELKEIMLKKIHISEDNKK